MPNLDPELFPLMFLYAEIHFRFFPLFPSLLYKKEPEIIFDLPRRIEPGSNLPVILSVNEINKYPVSLNDVTITASYHDSKPKLFKFRDLHNYETDHSLKDQLRAFIFEIPRSELPEGEIFVNATLSITKGRRSWSVLNDNLFSASRLPFQCSVSGEKLPGNQFCTYGDLHNHTIYSQSHVEFGPPLRIYDHVANASGLEFLGITDHSYDLACKIDNYLLQDQSLTKWKLLCDDFNSQYKTIMIQGEEISCLNNHGKVVHLCGLGINNFINGSLDGARKNIVFSEQLTISQAVKRIHDQGGIAFAAHPGSSSGLLQQIFLHRGSWSESEDVSGLDGFQALNSGYFKSWQKAKSLWINLLLRGLRIPLLGGNDAHGDFNRYRAISVPFFRIYEGFQRFMGFGKTGIYGKKISAGEILNSIQNGETFVTTGPYISIINALAPCEPVISNTTFQGDPKDLIIHALSTVEFGRLLNLKVLIGVISHQEKLLMVRDYKKTVYEIREPLPDVNCTSNCYIRAEIKSILPDGTIFEAFTSPCYLK